MMYEISNHGRLRRARYIQVYKNGKFKMKLYIINSGSLGNGYLLEASDGEQLLIEAGRPLKEFSKYGNLKRSRARGMLISHEHG